MAQQLNLTDGLKAWLDSVEKSTSKMPVYDQHRIENAGAEVFMKHLREETNAKHRSRHNDKKYGHAADHIGMSRAKDGSKFATEVQHVRVGWDNRYYAMNMMRVNDGTKRIIGDHFVTNLRENSEVQDEMLEAEKRAYNQVIKKNQEGDA